MPYRGSSINAGDRCRSSASPTPVSGSSSSGAARSSASKANSRSADGTASAVPLAEIVADEPGRIRIAFLGRPNVGKSTLVNRLLGEERMIASDVPGTTRDSIAVDLERDGREYRLIDTAGLRRRSKVEEAVEKFSVFKTLQAIENCQVAVVLLDAGEGVTEQDATVLGHVLDSGRALVIAVNKWDGQDKYTREQAVSMLERKLSFCEWAERVTISAKHGTGLRELFKAIHRAHASATHEFSTAETTKALQVAVESFPPPVVRGPAMTEAEPLRISTALMRAMVGK